MLFKRSFARIPISAMETEDDGFRDGMDPRALWELARSIEACGLLSPVIVKKEGAGYRIVAGRRRVRALMLLGRSCADAIVLDVSDEKAAVCSLVENIQREGLDCFEEAEALRAILELSPMTQDALAAMIGKSPSCVANKLRLLRVTPAAREILTQYHMGERYARALLRLPPEQQKKAAENAARSGFNVRQTEGMVDRMLSSAPRKRPRLLCRDRRLFLNALMRTVHEIETAGFRVMSRVEETGEGTVITLTLPKDARICADRDLQTKQNVVH